MLEYQKVRHMFTVEGISQRRIAKEMHISRNTVAKYCRGACMPGARADYSRAATVITTDVLDFIRRCLTEDSAEPSAKQHHTARRIYERLVSEYGFSGAESSVRSAVRKLRGTFTKVYVPLEFDPADAMQIDWGQAYIDLCGKRTQINYFCARLCYSHAPFVMCFRKQNTEAFLEAVTAAFEFFGGVPRRVIFDNAKVAVKSGYGKNAVSQERYAALAAHYCFETIYCNPASGNEKGLVEKLVGWARHNIFVPLPAVSSLAELNASALERCRKYIAVHHTQKRNNSVSELFEQEKALLLPLPLMRYDTTVTEECRVSPFLTVRFGSNNYSVPLKYAGRIVTVKASAENIRILCEAEEIAQHVRCYERNKDILEPGHYLPLLERKTRSILQAKPVRCCLSPSMRRWLEERSFTGRELYQILREYVEHGKEDLLKFKHSGTRKQIITDKVKTDQVSLSQYDCLISSGEVNGLCLGQG